MDLDQIGIYIHIPFCRAKCHYCDFDSFPLYQFAAEGAEVGLFNSYTKAVIGEIESASWRAGANGHPAVGSLYFGGGTPSLFPGSSVAAIIQACRDRFSFSPGAEVTLEANPESLSKRRLAGLKEVGVNRLSVGMQSLNDSELTLLGRRHSASQAVRVIKEAREAGFTNINIDLILGLPGQLPEAWHDTLERACQQSPDHLSCYALALEPETRLHDQIDEGLLEQISQDDQADLYSWTRQYLANQGYEQYEISNFSRPGLRSRHNLLYWFNGDYLGFGAGAHSHSQGRRWANLSHPGQYMAAIEEGRSPRAWRKSQSKADELAETCFLRLRLMEGLDLVCLEARFGTAFGDQYGEQIEELLAQGLLSLDPPRLETPTNGGGGPSGGERNSGGHQLRLTPRGVLLANHVFQVFV